MAAVDRRTVVGRRTEVGTTGVGVSSVRCLATFLAYSMPPIDSAKNIRQQITGETKTKFSSYNLSKSKYVDPLNH